MTDPRKREYVLPERILDKSPGAESTNSLLSLQSDQSFFGGPIGCVLKAKGDYVLLDFGRELSGGVKIVCNEVSGNKNGLIRLRLGESAMEAMSEIGYKNSGNEQAIRDQELVIPWVGHVDFGGNGFRFARIDNLSDYAISFRQVFAVYTHCGRDFIGSFKCGDERINKIWEIGARTVYLNMQEYIYDGIKRDRTVWMGDMHPETLSVLSLYGKDEVLEKSLDFVKGNTPPAYWMNGIPSYTLWWIKIIYDYYFHTREIGYLQKQTDYLRAVLPNILAAVSESGEMNFGNYFIDWPSSDDLTAQKAGFCALLYSALHAAAEILKLSGTVADGELAVRCLKTAERAASFKKNKDNSGNKQAAALQVMAGIADAKKVCENIIKPNLCEGVSAYLGCYTLLALGDAGDIEGALDLLKGYWGAMIDLGATSFWEDFDIKWAKGAKPLDALLKPGEYDIHGDNGEYCYKGYRHSLCHGWSSGPVSFLSAYILGVRPAEAGCGKVIVKPSLGDLSYAEGAFPTPYGPVRVRHEKRADGKIKTEIEAPTQVKAMMKR